MRYVVFTLPYGAAATMRFVRAAAKVPETRLGIISQEPPSKLPAEVRSALFGFERVRDALDPDQLTSAVRALAKQSGGQIDAIIGILEQLQEPLATVRERLQIRGMSVDEARNFRDKAQMKEVLRANDLPCARHALCGTEAEAIRFAETSGLPLVVKPPDGAGAKNTFRVDEMADLRRALQALPPRPDKKLLLEEFIVGEEFSFDTVTLGGKHLFHSISRYYPTPLEVLQSPWIQWCVLLPHDISGDEYAPIREAGPRALTTLGMVTGMTHMEWFRRPDGSIAISEVAARPPGAQFTSLISYAHDLDFYQAWVRLMAHEEFEAPERKYSVGAAFLRGQGSGRVVDVKGIEEARRELGDLVVEAKLPQKGQPPATGYEGEGYVILRDPDTERVKQGLKTLITTLRVEMG